MSIYVINSLASIIQTRVFTVRYRLSLKPAFDPWLVRVRFVVDKLATLQDFLRVLWFSPVRMVSPIALRSFLSTCCCYQTDGRAKAGNLRKRKVILQIG